MRLPESSAADSQMVTGACEYVNGIFLNPFRYLKWLQVGASLGQPYIAYDDSHFLLQGERKWLELPIELCGCIISAVFYLSKAVRLRLLHLLIKCCTDVTRFVEPTVEKIQYFYSHLNKTFLLH